jgi:hypothetical protein
MAAGCAPFAGSFEQRISEPLFFQFNEHKSRNRFRPRAAHLSDFLPTIGRRDGNEAAGNPYLPMQRLLTFPLDHYLVAHHATFHSSSGAVFALPADCVPTIMVPSGSIFSCETESPFFSAARIARSIKVSVGRRQGPCS